MIHKEAWHREADVFGVGELRREFERDPWNPAVVQRYFRQVERAGLPWEGALPEGFVDSLRMLEALHQYPQGYTREDELEILFTLRVLSKWL
ncbi:MAG: hypothetical protein Q8P59_07150, partial [Dehalococcoidia bacterium]|nr:hypothetical protein [Dehalococcoidia bacterium]